MKGLCRFDRGLSLMLLFAKSRIMIGEISNEKDRS